MNQHDVTRLMSRIRTHWPRFETTPGKVTEWAKAFEAAPTAVVNGALDKYITTNKWAPTIAELFAQIKSPAPKRKATHAASKQDLWARIEVELQKGRAYIREPHPLGSISFYVPLSRAIEVGGWSWGGLTAPRFVDANTELPAESWGRGEVWMF